MAARTPPGTEGKGRSLRTSGAGTAAWFLGPGTDVGERSLRASGAGTAAGRYSPARCFSQAQADARVSSRLRQAFQPNSVLARVGSAHIAGTSPALRAAIL